MISQSKLIPVSDSWQQQLRNTLTTADQLLQRLDLTAEEVGFSAGRSSMTEVETTHARVLVVDDDDSHRFTLDYSQ